MGPPYIRICDCDQIAVHATGGAKEPAAAAVGFRSAAAKILTPTVNIPIVQYTEKSRTFKI